MFMAILRDREELRQSHRVGKAELTAKQSFESEEKERKRKNIVLERQRRALQDFFRDTGGKISDLRVLRSAMYLSDEIDRAIRGVDIENQYVGWRQYNRFFAEGTEDLFTNIPTGRSPLVLAAPKVPPGMRVTQVDPKLPLPIEYQAVRRSHQKQVGRAIDEIEHSELVRLSKEGKVELSKEQRDYLQSHAPLSKEEYGLGKELPKDRQFPEQKNVDIIIPKNDEYTPKISTDLRVGLYQPFEPMDKTTMKERLLKFEGDISERRPEEDYKFEGMD